MSVYGIDVSKHQGDIDWSKVAKAGVEFAIIRAGYGKVEYQKDAYFEKNYAGCVENDIPCGVYWYSYAMSPEDAVKEAETCLEAIKDKSFEYPIYFDIEEDKQLKLGKEACTAIAEAFLSTVEKAGYWVGIYSSKAHLTAYIDESVRNRYAVWVAHYGVRKTSYKGQYGMWQKSSTGRVDGIKGDVDENLCYVDYPAAIRAKGLNGLVADVPKKEPEKEAAKPEYIKYTVKKGDNLWNLAKKYLGDGARYKEIMYASGITSETIHVKQVLYIPKR